MSLLLVKCSCRCEKLPNERNFRKEGFLLAPDLRVWSTFLGKTQSWSECMPGQESEREESRSLVNFSFSLWIGLLLWRVPTDLWVRSFPSLSFSLTMFRGVSYVIPNPAKLMRNMNHQTHECFLFLCQVQSSLPHRLDPKHSCWGKCGHTKWIDTPEPSIISRERGCSVLFSVLFDHYNMLHYCKMRIPFTETSFEKIHFLNLKST